MWTYASCLQAERSCGTANQHITELNRLQLYHITSLTEAAVSVTVAALPAPSHSRVTSMPWITRCRIVMLFWLCTQRPQNQRRRKRM